MVLSERLFLEPPHIGKGVLHVLFNLIILFVLKKARTTPGENLTVLNSSDLEPVETFYCYEYPLIVEAYAIVNKSMNK